MKLSNCPTSHGEVIIQLASIKYGKSQLELLSTYSAAASLSTSIFLPYQYQIRCFVRIYELITH